MKRPSLSLRIVKYAFLFSGVWALWFASDHGAVTGPDATPVYICFQGHSCERVIRQAPTTTQTPQPEQAPLAPAKPTTGAS